MTDGGNHAPFSPNKDFMQRAIDDVTANIEKLEGGPFGACLVHGGQVVAVSHNSVLRDMDATCHAEVNAIRMASRHFRRFDLSDCVIYSTTEPCPMCFSAIHWARIPIIVYGTNIHDVQRLGFNELSLSNERMRTDGNSPVQIYGDFMRDECLALLKKWTMVSGTVPY